MNEEVNKIIGNTISGFQWFIFAAATGLIIWWLIKGFFRKNKNL